LWRSLRALVRLDGVVVAVVLDERRVACLDELDD
jgi:hypothetical protein